MKIILSPAKKMLDSYDDFLCQSVPVYLEKSQILLNWLKSKNRDQLKDLWKCNDKIVDQNIQRLENMDLSSQCIPAVFAYVGLAYQQLSADLLDLDQLDYLQAHLRILSGFYGILRPFDSIRPYRLEMGSKSDLNLYEFWKDDLYLPMKDELIINLASKEYYDCIQKYVENPELFITIDFMEYSGSKLVTKGTYAKMARGAMVRFMAENKIENPEKIKDFNELGFKYQKHLSQNNHWIFVRE